MNNSQTGLRRLMLAVFPLAVIVLLPLVAVPQVVAQDASAQALLQRLERMERDLRALNRQVYRGDSPAAAGDSSASGAVAEPLPAGSSSSAYAARVEQKMSQFEAELRDMTGQVEGFGNTLRQLTDRLDKLVSDVDFRLSSLEARAGASAPAGQSSGAALSPPTVGSVPQAAAVTSEGPASGGPVTGLGQQTLGTISQQDLDRVARPSQAGAAATSSTTPSQASTVTSTATQNSSSSAGAEQAASTGVLPAGSPAEQYRFAFSLLRKADYNEAGAAFEEFLAANPDDKLAGNARYWLGETHYVRGDYRTAANTFLTGYQKEPKGSKAADSLLKLGMSLIGLKQNTDACATFDKLSADFSDLPPNLQRVLTRERARAECP